MTDKKNLSKQIKDTPEGLIPLLLLCSFFLMMLMKNSDIATAYMKNGLNLCANSVIPALFPFMVMSELFVALGGGNLLARLMQKPLRVLFGISSLGGAALILGCLLGFPIGAKQALALYDNGMISKKETERLIVLSGIPSSGFLIGVVGSTLYGNKAFGIFLYFSALFSVILMGHLMKRLSPLPQEHNPPIMSQQKRLGVETFTKAISSATSSMLTVCSYVIFFTCIVGCLSHMMSAFSLTPSFRALLFGLFEISSGVNAACSLGEVPAYLAICGFIVGWSGLSVHFQILSLCCGRELSFRPYFLSKLCQGFLCGALCYGYAQLFPRSQELPSANTGTLVFFEEPRCYTVAISLLFFCCLFARLGFLRQKSKGDLR